MRARLDGESIVLEPEGCTELNVLLRLAVSPIKVQSITLATPARVVGFDCSEPTLIPGPVSAVLTIGAPS